MRRMTPKRILARDRRMAAVHEAGHWVMAEWVMAEPWSFSARIEPTESNSDYEKTWIGQFQYLRPSSQRKRKLVAVAGAVAELCWFGQPVEEELFWLEPGMMSDSDWRLAGCNPGEPDRALCRAIEKAGELLCRNGPLWGNLILKSRDLIGSSRFFLETTSDGTNLLLTRLRKDTRRRR